MVSFKVDKHVSLIGLMGVGKSSVGQKLAARLNIPFVDGDKEIEDASQMSVTDIFDTYGEAEFRRLEERVTLRLLSGPPQVIATGGGAFINPILRKALLKNSLAVWLRVDLETLLQRTNKRRRSRPLLRDGNPREVLEQLIKERYPIYAEAPLVIDSVKSGIQDTVDAVIQKLEETQGAN